MLITDYLTSSKHITSEDKWFLKPVTDVKSCYQYGVDYEGIKSFVHSDHPMHFKTKSSRQN